jgi:hypothetical protein
MDSQATEFQGYWRHYLTFPYIFFVSKQLNMVIGFILATQLDPLKHMEKGVFLIK